MDFADKGVVITGGASGIGAALARHIVSHGGRVCIADRDSEATQLISDEIGAIHKVCDVRREPEIVDLVAYAEDEFGQVDCFVSNAGVAAGQEGHAASASNDVWALNWEVHVMSHVYAARACLPKMLERGAGYFVNVASAAGLLNQIDDAAYSATKHAAVSFAESLNITHGDQGIGVSVVCPQYVATPLINLSDDDAAAHQSLLTADEVAKTIVDGVSAGHFRILPHSQVADYVVLRAQDPDRWLAGMRKLRAFAYSTFGQPKAEDFYKLV
ncbi:MAG: SDR family NAD(P)-dependent oxidoreductase [Pseudomonadota bacterium]